MMKKFQAYVDDMPSYLSKLESINFIHLAALKGTELPQAGIYVLYERGKAQYVGRTGRLKARLKEHGHKSSTHFGASFAFILAKKQALLNGIDCNRSREALVANPDFKFEEAKEAVRLMQFKFVEITDPIAQTLFEVYAALELNTPHNSFENH